MLVPGDLAPDGVGVLVDIRLRPVVVVADVLDVRHRFDLHPGDLAGLGQRLGPLDLLHQRSLALGAQVALLPVDHGVLRVVVLECSVAMNLI